MSDEPLFVLKTHFSFTVFLSLHICLFIHPSIHLSTHPSIHLSIHSFSNLSHLRKPIYQLLKPESLKAAQPPAFASETYFLPILTLFTWLHPTPNPLCVLYLIGLLVQV